jgi:hypothetical protein
VRRMRLAIGMVTSSKNTNNHCWASMAISNRIDHGDTRGAVKSALVLSMTHHQIVEMRTLSAFQKSQNSTRI